MENSVCQKINNFCYVCGHIVPKIGRNERKNLCTPEFKFAYTQYFDEQDLTCENFTPNAVCNACYSNLLHWLHGRRRKLQFCKPVIWLKDPNGHDDARCYACINYGVGNNRKKLRSKKYVAACTALLPVPCSADVEPPKAPSQDTLSVWAASSALMVASNFDDPEWLPDSEDAQPELVTQSEMDYIVAKMELSQRNSEMLTSFLKRKKLTKPDVNATSYRKRQAEFQEFYTIDDENTFTCCNDIKGLVNKMGMEYTAGDWRLFIDTSVSSLKVVLLHKTNKRPSIPLALGTNMKETYETLDHILKKIKYIEHEWKICCDLKVVNILQGIINKGGFPKYFCFLCNWDSRSKLDQYQCKHWIKRTYDNEKQLKLLNEPLIKNIDDILLPPLHIKLGISKKFIEVAVKQNDEVFDCLKNIFPKLSNDKIKNGKFAHFHIQYMLNTLLYSHCCKFFKKLLISSTGVLNGPDIRKLVKSETFSNVLKNDHRRAWDALKAVIEGILGKNRVHRDKAQELVKKMMHYFHKIGASMTLKLHFLHHHLDQFLQQLPSESDEQGERFHQVTMPFEKRYKGKKLNALLAEVCWWSHKVSQYEDEGIEDVEHTYEGHTERDMPLNVLATLDDNADSVHASEVPIKKPRI